MCRELSNTQSEAKRLADLDEKERAEEIRKTAMETYGESKKRKNEGDDDLTSPRQKRRSGTETVRFLTERSELAKEQHIEEMKVRNEELLVKKQEVENSKNTTNAMLQNMQMQMQLQQQQMNQQFQMQQQQAQQQAQLFATLIEKLNK